MKRYQLTLNETQLNVLQHALDLYFRLGMGQVKEATDRMIPPLKDTGEWCNRRDATEAVLIEARRMAMPELASDNSYYSIHSQEIDESNRVACDIHDVVRHRLAWDRFPKGNFGVAWDTPAHKSREPLPTIVRCVEDE